MAADLMPRISHIPDQLWESLRHPAKNKKCRLDVFRIQQVQRLLELEFDAGRSKVPGLRANRVLDFGRVEIFFDVDRQRVDHGSPPGQA
jgi:hypothetical protein